MSFLDYLKQFEDEFKNAEVNTDEFGNIPDGKYKVRVDR